MLRSFSEKYERIPCTSATGASKRIRIDVRTKTFILSYFRENTNIYNHNLHDESEEAT